MLGQRKKIPAARAGRLFPRGLDIVGRQIFSNGNGVGAAELLTASMGSSPRSAFQSWSGRPGWLERKLTSFHGPLLEAVGLGVNRLPGRGCSGVGAGHWWQPGAAGRAGAVAGHS